MTLATLSFQLYTDSGLTTLFSGVENLINYTDLSDNPQIFTLYYGNPGSSGVLRAVSNPGVDQIAVTPTDILPKWTLSTAYVVGNAVQPTSANTFWYQCTTAGTSSGTEPTWPTGGIGSTVVDGGVVWTLQGIRHPLSEIKLASTSGGLSTATGGAALNLGTSISFGVGNAKPIWIQITNTVITVSDDTAQPHNALYINAVQQTVS